MPTVTWGHARGGRGDMASGGCAQPLRGLSLQPALSACTLSFLLPCFSGLLTISLLPLYRRERRGPSTGSPETQEGGALEVAGTGSAPPPLLGAPSAPGSLRRA